MNGRVLQRRYWAMMRWSLAATMMAFAAEGHAGGPPESSRRRGRPTSLTDGAILGALSAAEDRRHAQGEETQPDVPGVRVTLGPRTVVRKAQGTNWFPNIHRMANGNLVATCNTNPDETNIELKEHVRRLLSTDGGRTWKELGPAATHGPCKITLRDGTYLKLWFYIVPNREGYVTRVVRSTDNGLTYSTERDVPVYFPADTVETGSKGNGSVVFDGGLVEMDNGDLLATMYGAFKGDKKSRVILMKSSNKGHSWHYLSTVAHDPAVEKDGFSEPALIRTDGTNLFVTMRIGQAGSMYQCHSADAGQTWSKPKRNESPGAEPDLVMTDGGVLVCSYGWSKVYVMCSPDGQGSRWVARTLIYGGHCTGYTGLVKMGPNRFLLVHDALAHKEPGDTKAYNYVFVVPVTIERVP